MKATEPGDGPPILDQGERKVNVLQKLVLTVQLRERYRSQRVRQMSLCQPGPQRRGPLRAFVQRTTTTKPALASSSDGWQPSVVQSIDIVSCSSRCWLPCR